MMKYIQKYFVKTKEGILIDSFWNLIILGFLTLPLGINPSTPFFVLAIVIGIFYIFKNKKRKNEKTNFSFLSLSVLFIILTISITYTSNKPDGWNQIIRCIPLLLFPIILQNFRENRTIIEKIIKAMVIGLILSFCYNLFFAFYNSINLIDSKVIFDSSIEGGYSFYDSFNHGGNHFIGGQFSKLVQPSYVALYILVILVLMHKYDLIKSNIYTYIVLLIYIFLLSSRSSFLIILLLLLMNMLTVSDIKKKMIRLVFILSAGYLLYLFNPRINIMFERFQDFSTKKNYNYTTSEQSRILIYYSAIRLIKQSPIIGYGVGDANEFLYEDFVANGYRTNAKNKYNAHNQYLQTTLQIGLIGLIFLIIPFIFIFINANDKYTYALLLIIFVSLMFESMLVRYNGIIFYSLIIPIISRIDKKLPENN